MAPKRIRNEIFDPKKLAKAIHDLIPKGSLFEKMNPVFVVLPMIKYLKKKLKDIDFYRGLTETEQLKLESQLYQFLRLEAKMPCFPMLPDDLGFPSHDEAPFFFSEKPEQICFYPHLLKFFLVHIDRDEAIDACAKRFGSEIFKPVSPHPEIEKLTKILLLCIISTDPVVHGSLTSHQCARLDDTLGKWMENVSFSCSFASFGSGGPGTRKKKLYPYNSVLDLFSNRDVEIIAEEFAKWPWYIYHHTEIGFVLHQIFKRFTKLGLIEEREGRKETAMCLYADWFCLKFKTVIRKIP